MPHRYLLPFLFALLTITVSASESLATQSGTTRLRLVSYNVWCKTKGRPKRIPALLSLLRETRADVIALQEVFPWFLKVLQRTAWIQKRYRLYSILKRKRIPRGGLVFLSRFPLKGLRYVAFHEIANGRGLLYAVAHLGGVGGPLTLANTHLSAPLRSHGARVKQLKTIYASLGKQSDVVLLGDFNFGKLDLRENRALDRSYRDLWLMLRPTDPGFTWDRTRSWLADKGSFSGELSRRLDRIFLRSSRWKPQSIRIIGDKPLSKSKRAWFPSDHFGLLAIIGR